ncbi:MAG: molecular chaperone [Coriobacteriales bacterium]
MATADTAAELSELMRSRASTYGLLARLYRVEVDATLLTELQHMRFPVATGSSRVDQGFRMLYDYLRASWQDSVTELAIDYVRTFIGHGINGYSAAYPFESVYTNERRLMMQEARAEVLKILRDNHLKRGAWNEGEDHIALELEFMQRMSLRVAEALDAGDEDRAVELLITQREFVANHLLNWMPMLVADMQKFSKTLFYQGLAVLSLGYVEEDAALIDELVKSTEEAE